LTRNKEENESEEPEENDEKELGDDNELDDTDTVHTGVCSVCECV
jgi:hypothetical protein